MSMSMSKNKTAHILVYPFPGSGHIIPLLDLTHLLLTRGLTVTVLVSPAELHLLDPLLSSHPSSLKPLILSPPILSPANFSHPLLAKVLPTTELYNPIVDWFRSHPSPPVAIVSDFFLGWTGELASELGVPRVVFSPSGALAFSVFQAIWRELPGNTDPGNENALISFQEIPNSPDFPLWRLTHVSRHYKDGDPVWERFRNGILANETSFGILFNSFTELERVYLDYLKKKFGHDRVWAVGPLLPENSTGRGGSSAVPTDDVLTWLDGKPTDSVVYVCFGSRVTLNDKQMKALAAALECSTVHFILCVRALDLDFITVGFQDRVAGRGFIIKGWAPQVAILRHRAVGTFVTHCGWNSVLEGVAAGVMLLTWPSGDDQFTNSKMLVDQMGVAARVCIDGPESVPDSVELGRLLDESVSSDRPERVKMKKLGESAYEAVNGGSSTKDLDTFVVMLGL